MNAIFVVSLVLVIVAIVSVFVYMPLVSDYAFWVAVLGFILLVGNK
jgi:hypothetical protein